jgi:glutaredoxin
MAQAVTLFYNETCPLCRRARDELTTLLADRGIAFVAREVTKDVANRDLLILTSGQVGAPVVLVDKREVVGLQPTRLQRLLGIDVGEEHAAHW